MNPHKPHIILLCLLAPALILPVSPLLAQELEARVTIDRSRVSSSAISHFDNMEQQVETYLNENDWTSDTYQEHERIHVDIQITLLSADNNYNYEASMVIRSQRPIYNSLQRTSLLLFNDENWAFHFSPNQGLIHDELQFNPFTTVLDFYAYLVIGMDADSFGELGGTPYYTEAQNLVSIAQTASSGGWSRSGSRRNRAQLVGDLLSPGFEPLRRAIYVYHRLGLDRFLDSPQEARREVLRALRLIERARGATTTDLPVDTFFNAKYREIASIFEDASTEVRLEAFNLLSNIDPGHLSEYEKLRR